MRLTDCGSGTCRCSPPHEVPARHQSRTTPAPAPETIPITPISRTNVALGIRAQDMLEQTGLELLICRAFVLVRCSDAPMSVKRQ